MTVEKMTKLDFFTALQLFIAQEKNRHSGTAYGQDLENMHNAVRAVVHSAHETVPDDEVEITTKLMGRPTIENHPKK